MPFRIVRNDITKMNTDAIVNTANAQPTWHSGTDSAIYSAAGTEQLLEARRQVGELAEGQAGITPGFKLTARYIIHVVSPRYIDGRQGEAKKLKECYDNSLRLAVDNGCRSIAFPLISTGNLGYPKEEAIEIALSSIQQFLMKEDMMVYLVVFDKESVKLTGQLFEDIKSYIDDNYVGEAIKREYKKSFLDRVTGRRDCASAMRQERPELIECCMAPMDTACPQDIFEQAGETFQQCLFRMIDERGLDDVVVYKAAGKDKKLFSKIKNNVNYQPSKHTVFAFAIALKLNMNQLKELLESAGFALSPSSRFDLLMRYVFQHSIYDMYKIDCMLFDCGLDNYFCCD